MMSSWGVLILRHAEAPGERTITAAPGEAVDSLPWLRNAHWSCKDNKSKIIDCSTVLECFWAHQSHFTADYKDFCKCLWCVAIVRWTLPQQMHCFFLVGFHGHGSLISYLDGKKRKTRKTNNAWNDNQSPELSASALFTMNSWQEGHVVILIMAKLRLFSFETNCECNLLSIEDFFSGDQTQYIYSSILLIAPWG